MQHGIRFFLKKRQPEQSTPEELANSISHGIALASTLAAAPLLIMRSAQFSTGFIVSVSVFSATTILLYLASTLYHALPNGKAKHVFRVLEHSAIFLLIAGTYTPFSLGALHGAWGWSLFGVVWGIAALGVLLKAIYGASHPKLSTSLYLAMGWVIVIAIKPMLALVPTPGLIWLLAGGLFYSIGVIFFALDARIKYGHFVWHLFVMAGTLCHGIAVFWYAA